MIGTLGQMHFKSLIFQMEWMAKCLWASTVGGACLPEGGEQNFSCSNLRRDLES